MKNFRIEEKLTDALKKAGLNEEDINKELQAVKENLDEPVKLIGAGQTGVGKSTLIQSIFAVEDEDIPDEITTDATQSETQDFKSFEIENEDGFKIRFTDGPGLGESIQKDKERIPKWIDEIQKHDALYWVLDASSRDIAHIQRNIKNILDETGYRDRVVVVLNKVDQIELEQDDLDEGKEGWDEEFNVPTPELEEQIERRTDDIIEKLSDYAGISEDQIIPCSALKRWNHGEVLDKLIESLPPEKRIKASANRDVEDFKELMSDEALEEIQQEMNN
jgi:predicted GTPase